MWIGINKMQHSNTIECFNSTKSVKGNAKDKMKDIPSCEGCHLFNREIFHRVCIPKPSDQIKGGIISRDPTSDFIGPLKEYKINPRKRGNLLFDAPPRWLCDRIQHFMNLKQDSFEMKKLCPFIDCECYWTHFHKCPTQKNVKRDFTITDRRPRIAEDTYPPFRYSNGKLCANKWLDYEFDKFQLHQKIVILLGRDLQKYFMERPDANKLIQDNFIFFPHPSSANCGRGWSWNVNKPKTDSIQISIEKNIKKLLDSIPEREEK
jgi:hypothetical protein